MTKIRDLQRRWAKDADHKEAYDALGEELDLARALIEARAASRRVATPSAFGGGV